MLALQKLEFGSRRLPLLLQTEAGECGLACIAMVACHHGFRTDLASLRGRFGLSLNGANLEQLGSIAERLHMSSRALRLEPVELGELQMPCLLHWDMNHFVVLRSANTRQIVIHDPAFGVRHLSYAEVGTHFTGVALELTPTAAFQSVDERRKVSLARLIGTVRGKWRAFGSVLVMALALEALALLTPMFNQWVVDEVLVTADRGLLNVLAFGTFLLMITQTALSQARGWVLLYLSTHLNLQWVGNVFTHLLRLPVSWFERRELGDVVSRFGAVGAIQRTITTGFIGAVLDGLMGVMTFVMMLLYSPTLSVVVLVSVALYALLRMIAYRPLREAGQEGLAMAAKEQSCFLETVRAVQAIKLFGRERDRGSRWLNLMVDSVNRSVRTQKLELWFTNAHTAVSAIANLFIFWIGAGMVMNGSFTIGMLFAFTAYGGQFGARMVSLINHGIAFRMLSLHAERLADIVLESPEPEGPHQSGVNHLLPQIELINVGFRYAEGEPWVLRNLDLVIAPGEAVAIVGASGCGKSTLIKLILNVLVPTEGEIRYGGVSLGQLGARAYRSALAAVMQDDVLLAGSLAENISFFEHPADLERVRRCAQMASMDADIAAMPMGYETLVGDMGSTLSGGQKQRVLLARALYKQPKVLVLDEATSNLDVALERTVNAAVAVLKTTRIIVAHRPETIASARRVITLERGKIAEDMHSQRAETST